jgi:beta-lactam-binding protein with PASTA domain
MAEVYLAHDYVLDRDVALKVMSGRYADDDEFVERFKREAQSAAALSHPNIVSIYDRGEAEDGTYYIAMEYLPGGTLKDRLVKRGPLPPYTAAAVALQIAEALHAAHRAEVVHRDIKPHNVLITGSGDAKVGDFGIARAASSSTMTRTGSILGTAHYISPEQAMGDPVGPQSDLYSLGVVLYEMLTGTLPYDAETPIAIAMKHVNGHLVTPRELNPKIPEGMNAITVKLLAKDPKDRYASAVELIEDLERVTEGLEPANATTREIERITSSRTVQTSGVASVVPPETRKEAKRRKKRPPLLLLLLLLLALLGGLGYALLPNQNVAYAEVPDLLDARSIDEARAKAGNFRVIEGGREDSREPKGAIIRQNPEPGEQAEEGSQISVTLSARQMTNLPNVEGETREEAERILEEAGFEVVVNEEESSAEYEGYVTEQDPRGGEGKIAEVTSVVAITIGTGPAPVKVPDLYNLTPERAKEVLEEAGLLLGSQTEASNDRVSAGYISDQQPTASTEVEPGSSVHITVSSGPKKTPVPNVVGRNVEEAKQTIWDAGFGYTVETVAGSQPAGIVVSTDPEAGTQLDPYSRTVTIRQSAGPPPQSQPAPQPNAAKNDDKSGKNGKKDNDKAEKNKAEKNKAEKSKDEDDD